VEELEEEHSLEGEPQQGETEELIVTSTEEITVLTTGDDDAVEESEVVEENTLEEPMKEALEEMQNEQLPPQAETQHVTEESPELTEQQYLAEQEIARLNAEVERLRQSMAGAADVIEELETPPMPPAVMEDIVIAAHIVSDFARLARQLDREQLIRATMGTIAMLHPDNLGVLISTRNMTMLPRLDERGLCAGHLGRAPPRGAPLDWRILEVVLASVSLVTGGPAAVIHSHGAYTTAASCEKDLVLVQPIDEIGKKHIGKVIIVDPDHDNPEDFLRQIAEALNQGGMRCVVIRGMGAYAVGADMDQAWANAAMLEHSMRIVLLARQANLKI
jgi:ribulose-5-phosphate 4-epimerase/fuculose-1-phosphate aldolase